MGSYLHFYCRNNILRLHFHSLSTMTLVVLLRKPQVPQEFWVNPFQRWITLLLWFLNSISVPFVALIVVRVILWLRHVMLWTISLKPWLSHQQQGRFLRIEKRGREKPRAVPEAPGKFVPSLFSTQKLQRTTELQTKWKWFVNLYFSISDSWKGN